MKNPTIHLKMRILGTVDFAQGENLRERIKHTASLPFTDEDGQTRQFSWRTISAWHYLYKSKGVEAIMNQERSDKGKARKTTPEELLEAINAALPHFHERRFNKSELYRFCVAKNLLRKEQMSPTTFFRYIREHGLLEKQNPQEKKRLAFAMQYANELWQADTMFGPYVSAPGGGKRQAKLIAFIDDASRVICHGEFFFDENTDTLIQALRAAFYKRGVPVQLYCDNGSVYISAEIKLICSRVKCVLLHTPVRDGAAKGKIERFFRRVRDQFLVRMLDLSSLENLNRQFTDWVEEDYNSVVHSAIGMKPIDRFAQDLSRIRFLPTSRANDELFFYECERTVKKDNTFSIGGLRYEAPVDLREKRIQVRYERNKENSPVVVYYKHQRMGATVLLDIIDNGMRRRAKPVENSRPMEDF
jgi:putative transposase